MHAQHRVMLVVSATLAIGLARPARCDDAADAQVDIETLLDKLQEVSRGDYGYSTTRTGDGFLPLGVSQFGSGLLGVAPEDSSDTLRDIVALGAEAIPYLIDHLDDDRETSLSFEGGGMVNLEFAGEYSVNSRTTPEPEWAGNAGERSGRPLQHTVTVGDLCFVALGQIVNRRFSAVRYQPTMNIMVNSPTHSDWLLNTIRAEWEGLTPEEHRASLLRDFLLPDHEGRRNGAALRIGYYYPEMLEPLVLHKLSQPRYDVMEASNLIRDQLYPASAAERRNIFDAAVLEDGDVMRDAIQFHLFEDLFIQEYDERRAPAQEQRYHARECLIELFGYPADIHSRDMPDLYPVSDSEQARFIDTIWFFPSHAIDSAVLDVLNSTTDDYLAEACFDYLIDRGKEEELQDYLARNTELMSLHRRIGWTRLHWAAVDYDASLEQLAWAIEQTPNIDVLDANGLSALHLAASMNRPQFLDLLIGSGANPNLRDPQGNSPIDIAQGEADLLSILLEAGAEPTTIHAAAMCDDTRFLLTFLESEPDSIHSKAGRYESTPLHLAAQANRVAAAELLLDHGADVNAANSIEFTPLHVAVNYGSVDMINFLLTHGADRELNDSQRRKPLYYAAMRGDQEIIHALQHTGKLDDDSIHAAAIAGNHKLVVELLEADPSLVHATLEWQHVTPLHLAVRHNHLGTVQVLLDHGADANAADDLGRTPLHIAARYCGRTMSLKLLAGGADALLTTNEGLTPLEIALDAENTLAIEALGE